MGVFFRTTPVVAPNAYLTERCLDSVEACSTPPSPDELGDNKTMRLCHGVHFPSENFDKVIEQAPAVVSLESDKSSVR